MESENSVGSWCGRMNVPLWQVRYEHVHRLRVNCFRSVCIVNLLVAAGSTWYLKRKVCSKIQTKRVSATPMLARNARSLSEYFTRAVPVTELHILLSLVNTQITCNTFGHRKNVFYVPLHVWPHDISWMSLWIFWHTSQWAVKITCNEDSVLLGCDVLKERKEKHKERRSVVSGNTGVLEYIAVRTSELTSRYLTM